MQAATAIRTEPLDLVAHLLRPYSNQKLFLIIHFEARLDRARLNHAIHLLIRQHPILACYLSTHHCEFGWRSHQSINLTLVIPGRSSDSTVTAIDRLIQSYSTGKSGLDVCIIRSAEHDSLLVCIDHTVTDATGAKEICYQLATNYSRPSTRIISNERLSTGTHRGLPRITNRLSAARKFRALISARIPGGRWQFTGRAEDQNRRMGYLVRHLRSGVIAAIKKRFAGTHVTVNDILTAALFVAPGIAELACTNQSMPVQFMVDLRRYLPEGQRKVVANLSGVEHVWITKRANDSLGDIIQSAHNALEKIKQRDPGVGTAMLTEMAMRCGMSGLRNLLATSMRRSISTGMANPILSNFGVLDEQRLIFGDTPISDAFMLGPCLYTPGIMLVASTYCGRLTLSTGSSRGFSCAFQAENMLDGMCDQLHGLV